MIVFLYLVNFIFCCIDYTLNDPDYAQQKQPLQSNLGFINPSAMETTMIAGGGGIEGARTMIGQEQMVANPPTTQSRYPQRERIQIQRTTHRAISNVYPFKNPLSQIDSDEEGPSELNPMKGMPRNYPYQQNPSIPLIKKEEQKFFEGNSESKANKFFTK